MSRMHLPRTAAPPGYSGSRVRWRRSRSRGTTRPAPLGAGRLRVALRSGCWGGGRRVEGDRVDNRLRRRDVLWTGGRQALDDDDHPLTVHVGDADVVGRARGGAAEAAVEVGPGIWPEAEKS